MFPTLLADGAEGMQQLEIVVDPQNGKILRSETPLRVSLNHQLTDRDFLCCLMMSLDH